MSGSHTLSATNPGFSAGDKILIHQTRGGSTGAWEVNEILSYSTGSITTIAPLANNYGGLAQVLVLPQYVDVTINPGVTVSAKPWDGQVGGILAFLASGTVNINGTFSSNGTGYRGAPDSTRRQGEGTEGLGSHNPNPNGNGGGSGQDVQHGSAGGGGNGTAGAAGSYESGFAGSQGLGGNAAGTANLALVVFGGGGGNTEECCVQYSRGGNGGGTIVLVAKTVNVGAAGGITSAGNNGTQNAGTGGGGGAGGSILLRTQTATLGTNQVAALGGQGGPGPNAGPGGTGGVGRIRVEYCLSLSGSTNPAPSQQVVSSLCATTNSLARASTTGLTSGVGASSVHRTEFVSGSDTSIVSGYPMDPTGGRSSTLAVGRSSIFGDSAALLFFDLSTVPPGSTVMHAAFRIASESGGGDDASVEVHRLDAPWFEDLATWQDSSASIGQVEASTVVSDAGWYSFDVTGLVQSWLAGTCNYGLVLTGPEDGNTQQFVIAASREAGPDSAPILTVEYEANADGADSDNCQSVIETSGDLDCNGFTNPLDALLGLQYAGGGLVPSCIHRADVNCDNAVNPSDIVAILRYVAGLPGDPISLACPQIAHS